MDILKQLDMKAIEYFQKEAGKEMQHVLATLAKALEMSTSKEDDKYIKILETASVLIMLPVGMVLTLVSLLGKK